MDQEKQVTITGHCLCGDVSFDVKGNVSAVTFCHCDQCQRWHGNYAAYTGCQLQDLVFTSDDSLAWYQSSDVARRGFCSNCGSSLFWDRLGSNGIGIAAGSLVMPTGLSPAEHIFMKSCGDYYTIKDDLPQLKGDHDTGV